MTPEGEGVRIKAFYSILQYNVDFHTNFVFGIGNWDNYCVKQDGQWYFEDRLHQCLDGPRQGTVA